MTEEKPMAEWQKRCHKRTEKALKDIEENPEKYGVTREHINKVKKDVERITGGKRMKNETEGMG
jgi:hypothetical protein